MNDFSENQLRVLEKVRIECQDVQDLLGDFVDGDLSVTLRARLDAHVRSCSACQQFKVEYEDVVSLARELGAARVAPKGVHNRLRVALNERLGLAMPLLEE